MRLMMNFPPIPGDRNMKTTKLGISKVAAAALLAGAMLATGLTAARSRAETNNPTAPPATKPADAGAGADQPSAREDAAKALDAALLQRLERLDVTNATDEQQRWIRRATWDLTGRSPTKEEV